MMEKEYLTAPELASPNALRVTVSIGIFAFTKESQAVEVFLSRARQALEVVESRGGNQIITDFV
jgi:GGDEF domain-containing protein